MQMNLIVISGSVRFVIFDDRPTSLTQNAFFEVTLSFPDSYKRLTVPPGVWMAFQDLSSETSLILNVADIEHQPNEQIGKPLNEISFDWEADSRFHKGISS
jgi:dTDP-4-dehydrorhamnose 3,5-epimerase